MVMLDMSRSSRWRAPERPAAGSVDELIDVIADWQGNLPADVARGGLIELTVDLFEQMRTDLMRSPRLVILGEFNSGKTTLTNVLSRSTALSPSVLANTSVPAVVHADTAPTTVRPVRCRTRGARLDCTLGETGLDRVSLSERPGVLGSCIIIDTPGLSNPLRAEASGARYAGLADFAIWCTVASQCWKESERAIWESYPHRLRSRSLLVVTGAESVTNSVDRASIAERAKREAGDSFAGIYFLAGRDALQSLDMANGAVTDTLAWSRCGAQQLELAVLDLAQRVARERRRRSGRWTERVLRRLAVIPESEVANIWWLPHTLAWSDQMRRIACSARGRRVGEAQLLAEAHAATRRFEARLADKLERLGRTADSKILSRLVDTALAEIKNAQALTCTRRGLGGVTSYVFHEVGRLMQPSQQELNALRNLRRRLMEVRTEQLQSRYPSTTNRETRWQRRQEPMLPTLA
jgi:hypothetical protein